ncbi:F-BAR domain only protein 1 isoform X2 [Dryobates pubescens]|uniref:F-BAR domain only protein 1 isoform X2 n=1 Tax=Dryobates pubescens TaxID=118200 RepID=UPI0023B96ABB|nr:F-BAR domain only protein 1 isoform X2 [Dryobates pubescens]
MSYFTEHFWGEKHQGFDVLYHNMKHGQLSTKELADFVRERAAIEENYAKAMVKLSKMATNGTQLGTFAPLWEVFRISSDKLALCHLELMRKLQDLIKEISRYGEEQGRVHKKSKEEVSGTLEAVQLLQGVAQLLPKSKESYHSRCQEYERLRKEGTSQKEIDKAELKWRKAGEALRRAVDKYNSARQDFEQRMLDSAMRFQEVEEAHLHHMKGLISSYSHSVEDTHVQIGQVHEEFKQNVENIGTELLLRRFAESKGTGRERPGALDFEEYRLAPVQEGPKRSRSKAFRIPGLSRKERDRDAGESPDAEQGCPEVDEDGFTVRPDTSRSEGEPRGCSSSDSDYDEEEPRKFYVHIKPVQPREAAGSAEATMEQLKATVGNLILHPTLGGTVKRQSSRHVASLTPAPSDAEPEGTLAAGDSAGRGCPAAQVNSGPGKAPPDPVPPAALFGPPLESAFEAEDFPAPRAYVLTSSSSPFSSSSPENVEDSGLDSPSHPPPGPSPDSRPWSPQPGTPQSPLPKADPPQAPPPQSTSARDPSGWGPRCRSPSGRPPDPPSFAVFSGHGAGGLWEELGAAPRGRSPAPREVPSPDPFGEPWVRAHSPSGEQQPLPRPSSNSASSSSSSPAPQSGGESSSPSPWTCPGSGTSAAPAPQPEPDALPAHPVAAPREVPLVAPPRRSRTKRAAAGTAAGSNSDLSRSLSPSPSWSCAPSHSAPASLGERGFFSVPPPALGLSRGPSPVVLGSQDALPVATAFTEYVHAYFKGQDTDSCLVKVTGELTMSFPAGILRVFSGSLAPPVLSFRLLNAAAIQHFLPNAELLYSDPSQSDPSTRDFWLNMAALTGHLQRQAEQCPAASYYNVALLKYQFSRLGPGWAPLRLCVRWDCSPAATRVSVDYGYNAAALALPVPLANVHVLLPVDEPVANLRLQPAASWNLEEKRLLWRLLDIPGAPGQGGCGRLSASWEPLCGPSKPSPVAAQFSSEGSTLSGVEVELAGAGYRMSLVKKRFATGIYLAGS